VEKGIENRQRAVALAARHGHYLGGKASGALKTISRPHGLILPEAGTLEA
jgi:hypothetical protein